MKLHTKIVLRPCGCVELHGGARVMGLGLALAQEGLSFEAIHVEIERQLRDPLWFRIPEQRSEWG